MPGARINYALELGQARAHAIMREKKQTSSETNDIDCWIFTGSLNTDGYGQVKLTPRRYYSLPVRPKGCYC